MTPFLFRLLMSVVRAFVAHLDGRYDHNAVAFMRGAIARADAGDLDAFGRTAHPCAIANVRAIALSDKIRGRGNGVILDANGNTVDTDPYPEVRRSQR